MLLYMETSSASLMKERGNNGEKNKQDCALKGQRMHLSTCRHVGCGVPGTGNNGSCGARAACCCLFYDLERLFNHSQPRS